MGGTTGTGLNHHRGPFNHDGPIYPDEERNLEMERIETINLKTETDALEAGHGITLYTFDEYGRLMHYAHIVASTPKEREDGYADYFLTIFKGGDDMRRFDPDDGNDYPNFESIIGSIKTIWSNTPIWWERDGSVPGVDAGITLDELRGADMIIAFGGDGTILHLARTVALHSVPVLGVNLGSLGFMSELEVNELDRLRDLAQGRFTVESRMMLDVSVLRGGKSVYNNIALNDAVISKGSIARVVRLNIFTEEGQLTKVGGDGIIASTPTGSTGYSMAAGGPIVEPTARNLLLTPICPHSTRSSSYVLSPEHVITVEAPDANRKFVYLSVDGGKAFSLKNNDQVRVSTSKYTTRLVRLSKKSFCEILDKKMGGEVTKA